MALMSPCARAAACLILALLGLLSCLDLAAARPAPPPALRGQSGRAAWRSFEHLQDARRGNRAAGLAEVKGYLARFGYMPPRADHDDAFDEHMEGAVKRYQSRLGLPVTGRLDSTTLRRVMSPRCGVGDGHGHGHGRSTVSVSLSESAVSRFTFFDDGEPRWTRTVLTYAISPTDTAGYLPRDAVHAAFRRAFAHWARVIPVEFVETDYYDGEANIKVGFYYGDHRDGDPFDGPGGVLAHAGGPNDGGLHLDAAELWTVDLDAEGAYAAIDLESVATHEIGHVLGLGHSSSAKAVMYPSIGAGERKVELADDDVEGVQLLYGSNPLFAHKISASPGRRNWLAGSVSLVCVVLVMLLTHI
ncbi:hypothetical protein ACP70R_035689 [Stipagrostis hirtigluma subsp. patula]